jgi:predicted metal-binding protein
MKNKHLECLSLSEKGKCRNPQYARPSMSGFGINVAKLIAAAGWTMSGVTHATDSTTTKMANVYGLVLIC